MPATSIQWSLNAATTRFKSNSDNPGPAGRFTVVMLAWLEMGQLKPSIR